jgi:hypothetical protein
MRHTPGHAKCGVRDRAARTSERGMPLLAPSHMGSAWLHIVTHSFRSSGRWRFKAKPSRLAFAARIRFRRERPFSLFWARVFTDASDGKTRDRLTHMVMATAGQAELASLGLAYSELWSTIGTRLAPSGPPDVVGPGHAPAPGTGNGVQFERAFWPAATES